MHTLDLSAGTWAIGLFRDAPDGVHPWFALITIDARTGAVLERRFE